MCPEHIHGIARACWEDLSVKLYNMGVLSIEDSHALEMGCCAYQEYREAFEDIQANGRTYDTVTGHGPSVRLRPEVAIAADSWRRFMQFLSQYGLTAASRAKVAPLPQGNNPDAEADFA